MGNLLRYNDVKLLDYPPHFTAVGRRLTEHSLYLPGESDIVQTDGVSIQGEYVFSVLITKLMVDLFPYHVTCSS